MISLSFLELVNEAWALKGFWTATIGFAAGAFFMLGMDMTLPHIRFGEREASDEATLATQDSQPSLQPGQGIVIDVFVTTARLRIAHSL